MVMAFTKIIFYGNAVMNYLNKTLLFLIVTVFNDDDVNVYKQFHPTSAYGVLRSIP